jgi:hypothetical protein
MGIIPRSTARRIIFLIFIFGSFSKRQVIHLFSTREFTLKNGEVSIDFLHHCGIAVAQASLMPEFPSLIPS